jgi:hypothetical protein
MMGSAALQEDATNLLKILANPDRCKAVLEELTRRTNEAYAAEGVNRASLETIANAQAQLVQDRGVLERARSDFTNYCIGKEAELAARDRAQAAVQADLDTMRSDLARKVEALKAMVAS